jgi:hypothetical protein
MIVCDQGSPLLLLLLVQIILPEGYRYLNTTDLSFYDGITRDLPLALQPVLWANFFLMF